MSVYVQWPWPGAGLDCDKILNRKKSATSVFVHACAYGWKGAGVFLSSERRADVCVTYVRTSPSPTPFGLVCPPRGLASCH